MTKMSWKFFSLFVKPIRNQLGVFPDVHEALDSIPALCKLGVVVHSYSLIGQEEEKVKVPLHNGAPGQRGTRAPVCLDLYR